jgi:hypothetical protein
VMGKGKCWFDGFAVEKFLVAKVSRFSLGWSI